MIANNPRRTLNQSWTVLSITILYALFAGYLCGSHVVWQDEIATLSVVTESRSLVELFGQLQYYGHPGLWHLLLYAGYHIFPHPVILKIINMLICVLAVYLFLRKAPFNWAWKMLFIAGYFPLYLYPTFSRNYGISMLLVFAVAALYKDRWEKAVPLGIALFLLANAHVHSFIISAAVGAAMVAELAFFDVYRGIPARKRRGVYLGFGIWAAGLLVCLLQIMPAPDSSIFSGHHWTLGDAMKAAMKAVFIPGENCAKIFGFESKALACLIIFSLYAHLWRNKHLLIMFAVGVIGLNLFFELFFQTDNMRHQGAFYLLMVMVLWMDAAAKPREMAPHRKRGPWKSYVAVYNKALLTCVLVVEVIMAGMAIKLETARPFTSARAFSRVILSEPLLKEAIIVGIPEELLETMPYYLNNPLYFLSEGRFGKYMLYKTYDQLKFSLTDLLSTAEDLKRQFGKPVVIILGYLIADQGPYSFNYNYENIFTYSPEELKRFYERTKLIFGFIDVTSEEKYRAFLLKP